MASVQPVPPPDVPPSQEVSLDDSTTAVIDQRRISSAPSAVPLSTPTIAHRPLATDSMTADLSPVLIGDYIVLQDINIESPGFVTGDSALGRYRLLCTVIPSNFMVSPACNCLFVCFYVHSHTVYSYSSHFFNYSTLLFYNKLKKVWCAEIAQHWYSSSIR
jgi:hypothetical protein